MGRYAEGPVPGVAGRPALVRAGAGAAHVARVEADIRARRPLMFTPNDARESFTRVRGGEPALEIFGALESGQRAQVILVGYPVNFHVRVPDGADPGAFAGSVLLALSDGAESLLPAAHEIVRAFPLVGYRAEPVPWVELTYASTKRRRLAIACLMERNYETASDDMSAHYRKVAREGQFPLSGTAVVGAYRHWLGGAHPGFDAQAAADAGRRYPGAPLAEHVFLVDVGADPRAYRALVPALPPGTPAEVEATRAAEAIRDANPLLVRDRSLVMAWDIETWAPEGERSEPPTGASPNSRVFMIGATLHWKDTDEAVARVCLVAPKSPAHAGPVVDAAALAARGIRAVECADERALLLAFAEVWRAWAPDVEATFNGFVYDWDFVVAKLRRYRLLADFHARVTAQASWGPETDEAVSEWKVLRRSIKVDASNAQDIILLRVPGCAPLDLRVEYKRRFSKEETAGKESLNFYLGMRRLPSKEDMDHLTLFRAYETGDVALMTRAAVYCNTDSESCQRLQTSVGVVSEARAVGVLAHIPLADSLLNAGGMKVRQLLAAYCALARFRIFVHFARWDGADEDADAGEEKYTGGYVLPPVKGPSPYPVTGLDYSSLYPSVFMTYNISTERILTEAEGLAHMARRAAELAALGREYTPKQRDRELYGVTFRGRRSFFLRHQCDENQYGLFPFILRLLFARRKQMKVGLHRLEDQAEDLRVRLAAGEPVGGELEDVEFAKNGIDAQQKALKVFMNTFYGETGNPRSAFYVLHVAVGVTLGGQRNLKFVAEFVRARGFDIRYGDTDSLYIMCNPARFADTEARFAAGTLARRGDETPQEARARELVQTTMDEIAVLRDAVNDHLFRDNGTRHLSMAYEEVLYPVVFLGKKKYFGVEHKKQILFRIRGAEDLFVRGVDIIKMGRSGIAKAIGRRIMLAACDLADDRDMLQVASDVVRDAVGNAAQWGDADFVKTAAYRPDRANVPVQRFVARMREAVAAEAAANAARIARGEPAAAPVHRVPEAGERFAYVLVRQAALTTVAGTLRRPGIGDRMEFVDVARARGLAVDIPFYLTSYVSGLCARFINYMPQFQPPAGGAPAPTPDAAYKAADEFANAAAKKWLDKFIEGELGGTKNLTKWSIKYRSQFTRTNRELYARVAAQAPEAALVLHGSAVDATLPNFAQLETAADVVDRIAGGAAKHAAKYVGAARVARVADGIVARGGCAGVSRARLAALNRVEKAARDRLAAAAPAVLAAVAVHRARVAPDIDAGRREVAAAETAALGPPPPEPAFAEQRAAAPPPEISADEAALFRAVYRDWRVLVGVASMAALEAGVVEATARAADRAAGYVAPPADLPRLVGRGAERAAARRETLFTARE